MPKPASPTLTAALQGILDLVFRTCDRNRLQLSAANDHCVIDPTGKNIILSKAPTVEPVPSTRTKPTSPAAT